jgi:replication initiation and membrane attachment protein
MNERIKNLLPNDQYTIQMHGTTHEDYVIALTHLYQPLIGIQAVALYLTLLNERKLQEGANTHHSIMNLTNMDLDQFYHARLKLEAIGLLKTFVEEEDIRIYHYILLPPFSVRHFFQDSMLTILLEHQIGVHSLTKLKDKLLPTISLSKHVIEKTKAFNEVFSTIHPKHPQKNVTDIPPQQESFEDISSFDFEWIEQALRRNKINPKTILTVENKQFIASLVKIYHIDNLTLEKAILWSINENHELLKEELHEACKDYYVKNYELPLPKLFTKTEAVRKSETIDQKPKTKKERLIEHFETITHRELLEDFSQSGYASENEIKMLTTIMLKHGLPQGVMNVLVHYVLQKSDMKLTKNYVEKIASHWARKNVKTVQQAMTLAKAESKLYQTWGSKKFQNKKQEVLPDWFKNQLEQERKASPSSNASSRDLEREKEELAKALKNVSSKF